MATSGEMVFKLSVCQLHVCEFVLTGDGVFIENRSDDTQEAHNKGLLTQILDKESVILSFSIHILQCR